MGVREWYYEKDEVQRAYDLDRISREIYEIRTRFAIGMIYKCGDLSDMKAAERMAKAHGYDLEGLIKEVT